MAASESSNRCEVAPDYLFIFSVFAYKSAFTELAHLFRVEKQVVPTM